MQLSKRKAKGQTSLEFLLVMIASITAMAIIAPSVLMMSSKALEETENARASLFFSELNTTLRKMNVLSQGTQYSLKASPAQEWVLTTKNEKIFLENGNQKLESIPKTKIQIKGNSLSIKNNSCVTLYKYSSHILLSAENC